MHKLIHRAKRFVFFVSGHFEALNRKTDLTEENSVLQTYVIAAVACGGNTRYKKIGFAKLIYRKTIVHHTTHVQNMIGTSLHIQGIIVSPIKIPLRFH